MKKENFLLSFMKDFEAYMQLSKSQSIMFASDPELIMEYRDNVLDVGKNLMEVFNFYIREMAEKKVEYDKLIWVLFAKYPQLVRFNQSFVLVLMNRDDRLNHCDVVDVLFGKAMENWWKGYADGKEDLLDEIIRNNRELFNGSPIVQQKLKGISGVYPKIWKRYGKI